MPVHDWTRVDAGLFHDFHQGWTAAGERGYQGTPQCQLGQAERPVRRLHLLSR